MFRFWIHDVLLTIWNTFVDFFFNKFIHFDAHAQGWKMYGGIIDG